MIIHTLIHHHDISIISSYEWLCPDLLTDSSSTSCDCSWSASWTQMLDLVCVRQKDRLGSDQYLVVPPMWLEEQSFENPAAAEHLFREHRFCVKALFGRSPDVLRKYFWSFPDLLRQLMTPEDSMMTQNNKQRLKTALTPYSGSAPGLYQQNNEMKILEDIF